MLKGSTEVKNIVYITADQLGAAFVGCYGSGVNSTPTLDALANEGIRFERCYATHPVCAPNRSTMLTGRCDEVTGITENNLELKEDCPTIAHVLSQAGYCTGGFGKFHQTAMQMPLPKDLSYLGFEESVLTEDTKLGQWLDEIKENHPEYYDVALAVSWPMPYLSEYGENKEDLIKLWKEDNEKYLEPHRENAFRIMYSSPLPKELHQTTWITDKALEFIYRNQKKPFFCNISYVDPHDPYDPPKPYNTMYDPEEMLEPIQRKWNDQALFEHHIHRYGTAVLYQDIESIKKLRALYHGSIRFIDDQIKRIIDCLRELGLWENTIIIFTTDHGDMMLDHDLITKGAMHYDTATRCPLIVSGGGIHPQSSISDRLTCTLDFCPTICDLAHILDRPFYEGRSFARIIDNTLPVSICAEYAAYPDGRYEIKEIPKITERFQIHPDGKKVTQTEYQTQEFWQEITIQSARALRSIITEEGYRLTLYLDEYPGELFDLKKDPKEQVNLYDNPVYAHLKMQLMERHIKAFAKRVTLPQYRNLKMKNGQKWINGMGFQYFPTFTLDKDRRSRKID